MCRGVALKFAVSGFLLALVFPPRSFGAGENLKGVLDKTTQAVMRITVTHQGGDEVSVGTGFLCRDRKSVVTAYHLVAGADAVLVQTAAKTSPRIAKVWKVQKPSDLALLTLKDAAAVDPLPMGETPKEGAQVLSLGHAYGASAVESLTQMKIREVGASKLSDMLSENHRAEIARLGFPDLQLDLLNIEGNPAPGFSGAPVIDTSGRVVGVIDGGIESGAGSVSWAIPAKQIDALFAQEETASRESSATVKESRLLYAADLRAAEGPEVALQVNGFELVKRRTRTLGEMQQTTEDSIGLQQILAAVATRGVALDGARFDVYEHAQSGVCLVVPEGLALHDNGGILSGTTAQGRFGLLVRLDTIQNDTELMNASLGFDNYIGRLDPSIYWQEDWNWSYSTIRKRFDDALVLRRAAYGVGYPRWKYGFETQAARRGTHVAVAALNNYYNPQAMSSEETRRWAAMVLAVHLTQFSQ